MIVTSLFLVQVLLFARNFNVVIGYPDTAALLRNHENSGRGEQMCPYYGNQCKMDAEYCSSVEQTCMPVFAERKTIENKLQWCTQAVMQEETDKGVYDVCIYFFGTQYLAQILNTADDKESEDSSQSQNITVEKDRPLQEQKTGEGNDNTDEEGRHDNRSRSSTAQRDQPYQTAEEAKTKVATQSVSADGELNCPSSSYCLGSFVVVLLLLFVVLSLVVLSLVVLFLTRQKWWPLIKILCCRCGLSDARTDGQINGSTLGGGSALNNGQMRNNTEQGHNGAVPTSETINELVETRSATAMANGVSGLTQAVTPDRRRGSASDIQMTPVANGAARRSLDRDLQAGGEVSDSQAADANGNDKHKKADPRRTKLTCWNRRQSEKDRKGNGIGPLLPLGGKINE